ncbi:CD209 antigen-like protein E [Scomber scombrus]|uniref:CD209 antigen-like protein E n=1 Tax=Scomber scombrus TaxID=13677 RepID=UPI002DDBD4FA|nr:CD209 antigen-like protein E [Scomber scombrus]
MATVFNEEESEIAMVYENLHGDSARSHCGKDRKVSAVQPGMKLYRLVAVSFGLLCLLQVALNISLHLSLYSSYCTALEIVKKNLSDCDNKTLDMEASIETLTEERDELKKKLSDFDYYSQQGWVYFSGSFYYVSEIKKTWNNSRYDCLKRGADLLIVNTKEKQEFLHHLQRRIWIGLTDREIEGTWKWVDGSPLKTSYWATDEPNSYESTDEDCGDTKFFTEKNSWNDSPCEYLLPWTCEKKKNSSSLTQQPKAEI